MGQKMRMAVLAIATVCGCSSGSGTGGGVGSGQCPDLAGTWTIQSHCQSSQVGQQGTLTQSGCTVTDADGISIEVGPDGSFSYTSGQVSCTGTATETTITQNCVANGQTCTVTLTK